MVRDALEEASNNWHCRRSARSQSILSIHSTVKELGMALAEEEVIGVRKAAILRLNIRGCRKKNSTGEVHLEFSQSSSHAKDL